jgi:hypothetical protein
MACVNIRTADGACRKREDGGRGGGGGFTKEKVGDVVGDAVGDCVGAVVGDAVGVVVGDAVGDMVGESVGDRVGDVVDGELVGASQSAGQVLFTSSVHVMEGNAKRTVQNEGSSPPQSHVGGDEGHRVPDAGAAVVLQPQLSPLQLTAH